MNMHKISTNVRSIEYMFVLYKIDYRSTPFIMKTCPCNEDPLTPHSYIVKWGLQGYTIFRIFALKDILLVLVRTASMRRF